MKQFISFLNHKLGAAQGLFLIWPTPLIFFSLTTHFVTMKNLAKKEEKEEKNHSITNEIAINR